MECFIRFRDEKGAKAVKVKAITIVGIRAGSGCLQGIGPLAQLRIFGWGLCCVSQLPHPLKSYVPPRMRKHVHRMGVSGKGSTAEPQVDSVHLSCSPREAGSEDGECEPSELPSNTSSQKSINNQNKRRVQRGKNWKEVPVIRTEEKFLSTPGTWPTHDVTIAIF